MRQQIIVKGIPSFVALAVFAATSGILNRFVLLEVAGQVFGSTNETIGAAYGYFSLDDSVGTANNDAIFRCVDMGARCVFQRDDYEDYDFGGGQETTNVQGAVWAAMNVSTNFLALSTCVVTDDAETETRSNDSPSCLVICNANCTCTYENGTSCVKLDGRPDSVDIVETDPPAKDKFDTCPQQKNKVHCPALMQSSSALPDGLEDEYDCYNFCGGIFVSSCDLSTGNCGPLNCTNATADGTLDGLVFGCTADDLANTSTSGESSSAAGTFFELEYFVAGFFALISFLL